MLVDSGSAAAADAEAAPAQVAAGPDAVSADVAPLLATPHSMPGQRGEKAPRGLPDAVGAAGGQTLQDPEWDPNVTYCFYPEPEPPGIAGHPYKVRLTPGTGVPGLRPASGSPTLSRGAPGKLQVESLVYSLSRSGSSGLVTAADSLPGDRREAEVEPTRTSGHYVAVAAGVAIVLALIAMLLWPHPRPQSPATPRPASTPLTQGRVPADPTVAWQPGSRLRAL